MAEEENKPKAVLIKKEKNSDSKPAQPKKRVFVVKRKSPASPSSPAAVKEQKKETPSSEIQKEKLPSTEEQKPKTPQVPAEVPAASAKKESEEQKPAQQRPQRTTFEIASARPNVKAGNLSGPSRGRYNNYGRGNGGFTGTQAREGYQNRERDRNNGGQGGGYNRGGYNNGQGGGYNRGGYNNNGQGGGYNRGGYNNGQGGGYNRGGYNNNGQGGGYNRGGYNNNGQGGGFNRGGGQGGFGPRPGFGGQGGGRPFGDASSMQGNKAPAKKQFKGKK
ncbi:MAG: translation initiation factor IF-2, partial [Treponema sp.]|nr:translation initiation factor IF-2 [Treponema sp.]